MKVITKEDIAALSISAATCLDWVEESFRLKPAAQLPPKTSVHPKADDFINTMPCLLPPERHRFSVKIVSRTEGNHPALRSDILLYDTRSAKLLALIDGDWVTTMRTGAVAALSVRLFQRDGTDTYSLMGLGQTARATAQCILADRAGKPTRFRLLRYKDQAERFARELEEMAADGSPAAVEIVETTEELVAGADALISCITSAKGLLCPNDSLYREGMLLVPVHTRGFQNCDLFFDRVFGDDLAHIRHFQYFDRFRHFAETGDALRGEVPGRQSQRERILCYNIGLGLHDAVFADHLFRLLCAE